MIWPFRHKAEARYWLKAFSFYALAETSVQLIFFFIFNTFTRSEGSNIEYHLLMVMFHCMLIWPIWWVARAVRKQHIAVQVLANLAFAFVYGWCWFGPVQHVFSSAYNNLLDLTRPGVVHAGLSVDSSMHYSIINFQIVKHAFRLSWYYLAEYLYNYRSEEKKRIDLAVSNKELQLKLLKWHLNPSFYFRTISSLQQSAKEQPANAAASILLLAQVMEYVIYEARQPRVEMKREIAFLASYVQLISRHTSNTNAVILITGGEPGSLTIAPLLLAVVVDNIVVSSGNGPCIINMHIEGGRLELHSDSVNSLPSPPVLLQELYKERVTIHYSKEKGYRLSLELDAV